MNELQIFKNPEFGEVRTLEENGEVLFCGSDVAKSLGYTNPSKALSDHCRGVTKRYTPTKSGEQEMSFIPESDLYRLVFGSKLPTAEKFTDFNMPTQKSMDLGLFTVKETAITHSDGTVTVSKTTKVTGKGQQYFIQKFLGEGGAHK